VISELWITYGKAIKMANDIMIDIESLDTSPNCVILTIGAVRFDPRGMGIVERLELRPTIDEQTEKYNRVINEDTLRWWGEQSPEALDEAMGDRDRVSFNDCMEALYKFCWNRRAVWSNGASFDIVAMESAWRNLGMRIPWPYYTVRDTRTLYEVAGVSLKDKKYGTSTTHKAVEDAEHQAIVVQDAYRKLIKAGLALK
jgi:3' exoribonuclease, RNase T-like